MSEKKANQRILSIDALKGFAAFMILVVHGVVFGIFTPDPALFNELTTRVSLPVLIFLAPIILMATWFTVFLLFAGATIAFSFVRESYKEAPNYRFVLKKKIVNAIALTLLGALYGPLISHTSYNGGDFRYSFFTGLITTGELQVLDVPRFWAHSVFAGIAMGMVVIALMFYLIFTRFTMYTEKYRLIKLMLVLEGATIISCFVFEYWVNITGAYDNLFEFSPFLHNIVNRFYGGRHSMLPQLFFAFSGAIFSIIMVSPGTREEKHRDIRIYGWYRNLAIFAIFLLISFVTQFNYVDMITAEELSTLFHLGNLAMLNWLVCIFFESFDFASTPEKGLKRSAFLRTYAPVTMTVYCMEAVFAASLRRVFITLFGPDIFPWNGIVDVAFMAIIIFSWYYVIKLWSRVKYAGSFEWGVVAIMGLFGTKSSRLQVQN